MSHASSPTSSSVSVRSVMEVQEYIKQTPVRSTTTVRLKAPSGRPTPSEPLSADLHRSVSQLEVHRVFPLYIRRDRVHRLLHVRDHTSVRVNNFQYIKGSSCSSDKRLHRTSSVNSSTTSCFTTFHESYMTHRLFWPLGVTSLGPPLSTSSPPSVVISSHDEPSQTTDLQLLGSSFRVVPVRRTLLP